MLVGLVIMLAVMGLSMYVQKKFQKRFKKYAETPLNAGLTGREVAEKMLADNGIRDVKITKAQGMLTDHYNPMNNTVNLSDAVYDSSSVAAAAIAAHECGHAVQHAKGYAWLQMRSALVPVVSASNRFVPWLLIGGILMIETFPMLMLAGIVLFAASTLFSFITLPVEYDATKRGLEWLNTANITGSEQHAMAEDALNAAAQTYVVAAVSSLATLLYYVMIFLGASDS